MIKNFLKAIAFTSITFTVLIGLPLCMSYFVNTDKVIAQVVATNGKQVFALDKMKHEWTFEGEGFSVNDKIEMRVDTNFTDLNPDDDIVLDAKILK